MRRGPFGAPDFLMNLDEFYQNQMGSRWHSLRQALLRPARQIERENAFSKSHPQVATTYAMDMGSTFPAHSLQVQPGERVLDMCAAPGGKTLILLEALNGTGELIANDLSQIRRERLKRVLRQYIPEEMRGNLKVSGRDAARWGLSEAEGFDRILLDAPCSGERHLLADNKELRNWSPSRSSHLARRQLAMLCSAVDCLKTGGRLVYSTCAVSEIENDGVVEKLLGKRAGKFAIVQVPSPIGEPTRFGWRIWPDVTDWGPIYYCVMEKG